MASPELLAHAHGRRSALVVLVPEAEPAVAHWRERLDPAARLGVPAHLTVLFPFVAPEQIDDDVRAGLTETLAEIDAFDFVLDRVDWFDDDVVWLGPTPAAPFHLLTERIAKRWPDHPPYGGIFDELVPHLTIGDGADHDDMQRAAGDVRAHLPIRACAREVHLIIGSDNPGSWTTSEAFALRSDGVGG